MQRSGNDQITLHQTYLADAYCKIALYKHSPENDQIGYFNIILDNFSRIYYITVPNK